MRIFYVMYENLNLDKKAYFTHNFGFYFHLPLSLDIDITLILYGL